MQLETPYPSPAGGAAATYGAGALAARARGRERWLGGDLEAVEPSLLPVMPTDVEVLALLTRSRALLIAGGKLSPEHLYDLRTFKTCWAELGYLYRLAGDGKRYGGTVVTSLRQLVTGLAPLHPTWKLSGDEWEDRDRHHRSVRRRLVALAAAGLLEWTWRCDDDGERRATILRLLEVPELTADELAAAAARLEYWEDAYDPDLNSGSPIEIRDVRRAAAPLSASERQRRGCLRAREKAEAKRVRVASQIISDPPSGALSKTTEKSFAEAITSNAHEIRDVCGLKTRVTRSNSSSDLAVCAAVSAAKTASSRRSGREGVGGSGLVDESALLERIRARREALEPVLDLKAAQMVQRAGEVALWSAERSLPIGRVREAWVVWCFGEREAANWGACLAGTLDVDDPQRLGRAVRRYERHAAVRPEGWPELGLAALAQIAGEDAERRSEPSLHASIRALDQLSKRMRAIATVRDVERRDRQAERAAGRHAAAAAEPVGRFVFRRAPARVWPWWVQLDPSGQPVLHLDGELVVVEDRIRVAPRRDDREHIETLRDARLLAGLWAQADGDGRYAMATGNQPALGITDNRAALPGPYPAPPGRVPGPRRREHVDPRLLELARLSGLKLWQVTQMHTGRGHCDEDLDNVLKRYRAEQRRKEERDRRTDRADDQSRPEECR